MSDPVLIALIVGLAGAIPPTTLGIFNYLLNRQNSHKLDGVLSDRQSTDRCKGCKRKPFGKQRQAMYEIYRPYCSVYCYDCALKGLRNEHRIKGKVR